MNKFYVTGYKGHVGKALIKAGFFPLEADVKDPYAVEQAILNNAPDLVIHLASKSDVDWCEKNQQETFRVNIMGTFNVFSTLSQYKVPGVILSSDQIWAGGWFKGEYKEDSKKTPPVNVYGMSKVAAEEIAKDFGGKIIRTSFLFDAERKEMASKLASLEAGEVVKVPTFIKRSFLYLPDFIGMIGQYCRMFPQMPNVLHLAGGKTVSWYTFMQEVANAYDYDESLVVPRRDESKLFAPRPHNAGLNTDLARSLRFGYRDYVTGIQRMKNDSSQSS